MDCQTRASHESPRLRDRKVRGVMVIGFLILMTVCDAGAEVSFRSAQEQLARKCQSASIGQIAQERMNAEPKAPGQVVEDFLVYLQAGYDRPLRATFPKIRRWHREIGDSALGDLGDELINREQWEMVREYLEEVPMAWPYFSHKFIFAMRTVAPPKEVDAWLLERAKVDRRWHRYRFRIAAEEGRLPALMESYRARLARNPSDLDMALDVIAGSVAGGSARQPIDWITTTLQPKSASDSYVFATALAEGHPELCVVFAKKSLSMPFTQADRARMEREMPPEEGESTDAQEKHFRNRTRYLLADALRASGKNEEANALETKLGAEAEAEMQEAERKEAGEETAAPEELSAEQSKSVEPPPPRPAPALELDSARKMLESAEKLQDEGKFAEALVIYRQGLEIVGKPAEEKSETVEKRNRLRYRLCLGAIICLKKTSEKDALDFFLEELSLWPANAEPASDFFGNGIEVLERKPERARLWGHSAVWKFLGERADWRGGVQLAFRVLVDELPAEQRLVVWRNATALAKGNADRSRHLGSVEGVAPSPADAVDLLNYAVNNLPPGENHESAARELFHAALRNEDWATAEMAMGKAGSFQEEERLRFLTMLATSAMKANDVDTAMRCWERVANIDRTHIDELGELARLGLRDRLIAYYRKLATDEPECTMADDLAKTLEQMPR